MQLKQLFLGLGIILFLLGLVYVITYYVRSKTTLEDCRTQHRVQAWTTLGVGLALLGVWGLMNFVFGRSSPQYY